MVTQDTLYELAFPVALSAVAQGLSREETRDELLTSGFDLEGDTAADVLADALREAELSGVEREDIDDSWF
jgi:hypothetical protein